MDNRHTTPATTPWLTPTQAAEYLQIALGTLRNLTSQRRIPFSRRGGIVRYRITYLDRWLDQQACHGRASVADTDGSNRRSARARCGKRGRTNKQ